MSNRLSIWSYGIDECRLLIVTPLWYDTARKLMVYPLTVGAPLQSLPDAINIENRYFAVPHTLTNAQVLRYYDYPVVPIINDSTYNWPIQPGRTPLAHQKIMANFCVLHRHCFNLSDMGTMKTQATIWAADFLMKQHAPGTFRTLIVAPLSVLETIWAASIFKTFLHNRTFEILYGSEKQRLKALEKPADFYIVNPDGLSVGASIVPKRGAKLDGFSLAVAERKDIGLCVIDEASCYKDHTTDRHRIARLIIRKPYLWLLTGTPTPNKPTDAYGLAYMVNNAFGKSFNTFRLETMFRVSEHKWVPFKDGYDKARGLLTPAIRFDIKDVWDGPEMTTQQLKAELTPAQKQLMKELKDELTIEINNKPIDAINEAAFRNKYLQISAGAVYDSDHVAHEVDAKPRFKVLEEVMENAGGKIVVFAGLTSIVEMLYERLSKRWSCAVVNGSTPMSKRTAIFNAFQEQEKPHVIVADPGTMAHGVELYRARCAIWYTPVDSNEEYQQGNKRIHRPGQTHPVTVVQIVSNKTEIEVYNRLATNGSQQGLLLEMVRRGEL